MNQPSNTKPIIYSGFLIILIATVFAYSDIKNHDFLHWDDIFYIDSNKHIHSLSWENILWMFTEYASANWHPITWLSYAVNYQFWGKDAFVLKATNLVFHLFNSLLVFLLTYQLINIASRTRKNVDNQNTLFAIFSSIVAALLFSIHPQHVESVAWISGRKDILCTLFYLAALLSYLKQIERPDSQHWKHGTLILFVLALMSKSMAVTLPLVLILLDIYPLQRIHLKGFLTTPKQIITDKKYFFLIAGCVGSITLITQNNEMQTFTSFSFLDRISNASENTFHYLYTILNPFELQAYYPLNIEEKGPTISNFLAIAAVISISGVCVVLWKRGKKHYLAIWLFYIVTLLPVIGLIKVGHASAADRYAYLPTIGFYMLLGIAASTILLAVKKPVVQAIGIGTFSFFTCMLVVKTSIDTQRWTNDRTLWSSVIEAFPGQVVVAYNNLGGVYYLQKQYANAIEEYNKALAIQANNIGALENIATSYTKLGRVDVALEYYKKSVELNPDVAQPYMTLGDYYHVRKNIALAEKYYQRALELSPTSPKAMVRSAFIDYLKGDYKNAELKVSYLKKLNPNDIRGLQLLAKIKLAEKNFSEASTLANQILATKPDDKIAKDVLLQATKK